MKKKIKQLTIRQQIQQCPTLTPEERSLALFGLRRLRYVGSLGDSKYCLSAKFMWCDNPVIKGQGPQAAFDFWNKVDIKIVDWLNPESQVTKMFTEAGL